MQGILAAVLLVSLATVQAGEKKTWRPPHTPPAPPAQEDDVLSRQVAADAGSSNAPLLFCIQLCIEPSGSQVSALAADPETSALPLPETNAVPRKGQKKQDFHDPATFVRQTEAIRLLADVVTRHKGRMTVHVQTPYTRLCVEQNVPVLSDLFKAGHEIGLRFDAPFHLGRQRGDRDDEIWASVMKEEIGWLRKACPNADIRSWSGGGRYRQASEIAAGAGLSIMSDPALIIRKAESESPPSVNPSRPPSARAAKRAADSDSHNSRNGMIYLPSGFFARLEPGDRKDRCDPKWFDSMTEALELSMKDSSTDRVNVAYATLYSSDFRNQTGDRPLGLLDRWLTQIIDPLVTDGRLDWATFSQMADAYKQREAASPAAHLRTDDKSRSGTGAE